MYELCSYGAFGYMHVRVLIIYNHGRYGTKVNVDDLNWLKRMSFS